MEEVVVVPMPKRELLSNWRVAWRVSTGGAGDEPEEAATIYKNIKSIQEYTRVYKNYTEIA